MSCEYIKFGELDKIVLSKTKHKLLRDVIKVLVNKGKGKEKLKEQFTNDMHYQLFKNIKYKHLIQILLTENYVIFTTKNKYTTSYLIGINSDNKLFINVIDRGLYRPGYEYQNIKIEKCYEIDNINYINLLIGDDNIVRTILLYDKDLELDNIEKIDIDGFYRIQGDVVFEVHVDYDFHLEHEILTQISEEIEIILKRIVLTRLQEFLMSYGVTSRIFGNGNPRLMIFGVAKKEDILIRQKTALEELIDKFTDILFFDLKNKKKLIVEVNVEKVFGGDYNRFIINVHTSEIATEIALNIVKDIIKELKPSENTINFGRHVIRYYGIPRAFTAKIKLPILDNLNRESEYLIPITLQNLYVLGRKILISHPEHGEKEIIVPEKVVIRPRNILIDVITAERLNYYALNKLFKELFNDF